MKVCIIVPAYNEGQVIADVVRKASKVFKQSKHAIDIVVINDGSRDNTSAEARKGGAIVIDHILNSGAGAATATGLAYAKKHDYAIAASMDADGQHDPTDVLAGIDIMAKSNKGLLIGTRLLDTKGMSGIKVLGNRSLSTLTFILFGAKTTDSQSGLRVYSNDAIQLLTWKTSGYEFCSEMLWRAKQQGLAISEFPIKVIYTDYSKSKGQNNWNGVNILKTMVKQRIVEMFE